MYHKVKNTTNSLEQYKVRSNSCLLKNFLSRTLYDLLYKRRTIVCLNQNSVTDTTISFSDLNQTLSILEFKLTHIS